MKLLILLTTMMLLPQAFSAQDPEVCQGPDTCIEKQRTGFFSHSKTFYARGFGNSCLEAKENANEVFEESFEKIDSCGIFSGPHTKTSCMQLDNGEYIQWIQCTPSSRFKKKKRRRGYTNIGGLLAQ